MASARQCFPNGIVSARRCYAHLHHRSLVRSGICRAVLGKWHICKKMLICKVCQQAASHTVLLCNILYWSLILDPPLKPCVQAIQMNSPVSSAQSLAAESHYRKEEPHTKMWEISVIFCCSWMVKSKRHHSGRDVLETAVSCLWLGMGLLFA